MSLTACHDLLIPERPDRYQIILPASLHDAIEKVAKGKYRWSLGIEEDRRSLLQIRHTRMYLPSGLHETHLSAPKYDEKVSKSRSVRKSIILKLPSMDTTATCCRSGENAKAISKERKMAKREC